MRVLFALGFCFSCMITYSQVELETLGYNEIRSSEFEGKISFSDEDIVLYVPIRWYNQRDVIETSEVGEGVIEKYAKGWIYSADILYDKATRLVMNQRFIDSVVYNEINLYYASGQLWKRQYVYMDLKAGSDQYKNLRFDSDYEYHKNGQLKMKFSYNEGYRDGYQIAHRENGDLLFTCYFKKGLLNGPAVRYDRGNGAKIEEGEWESGERIGLWVSYREWKGEDGKIHLTKETREYFPDGRMDMGGDGSEARELREDEPPLEVMKWVRTEKFIDGVLASCEGLCD